jgi:hypothetical protein
VKTKLWLIVDEDEELEVPPAYSLPPPEARKRFQGTTICFPLPEEGLLPNLLFEDVSELVVELLALAELPAPPLNERTANSTRPELGLIMMSLIVPRASPEEDLICELFNWLAGIAFWPERPVALSPPEALYLPDCPNWLLVALPLAPWYVRVELEEVDAPGVVDEEPSVEDWAWAPSARHAAQNTIILTNSFFILPAFG